MSTLCWPVQLSQTLNRLRQPQRPTRIALLGIGNELQGDDGAGVAVARTLQPVGIPDSALILEAGLAPENQTGVLRRFLPDLVILVDAAHMQQAPGAICWLDWQDTTGISASTHTLPLHMFARYVHMEFDCEVVLLGIQPAQNAMFAPLSAPVQSAVDTIVQTLAAALRSEYALSAQE